MKFDLMVPAGIDADWDRLKPLLQKLGKVDAGLGLEDIRRNLMDGTYALYDVDLRGAQGVILVEVVSTSLWLIGIAGRISGPRSEWLGRVRILLRYFEDMARIMNCTELRLCGRNWSRILPNWEMVGPRNEMRLVL